MILRRYMLVLLALCAISFAPAGATISSPPPATLDQRTYNDPAMHYVAPAGVVLIGMRHVPYQAASHMMPVAIWGIDVGKLQARVISLAYERFSHGSLHGFYTTYINELRGASKGGTFVRREHAILVNGMPAYWLKVSSGEGLSQMRSYAYVWYDGVRGVVLSEEARVGDLSERQAKHDLAGASAVAYPVGRAY
ncbi:MAG: hypothetical protein ACP5O6_02380 [Candidatus Baltobacteraceae bacterium]